MLCLKISLWMKPTLSISSSCTHWFMTVPLVQNSCGCQRHNTGRSGRICFCLGVRRSSSCRLTKRNWRTTPSRCARHTPCVAQFLFDVTNKPSRSHTVQPSSPSHFRCRKTGSKEARSCSIRQLWKSTTVRTTNNATVRDTRRTVPFPTARTPWSSSVPHDAVSTPVSRTGKRTVLRRRRETRAAGEEPASESPRCL